jgi:hypothetical protein
VKISVPLMSIMSEQVDVQVERDIHRIWPFLQFNPNLHLSLLPLELHHASSDTSHPIDCPNSATSTIKMIIER